MLLLMYFKRMRCYAEIIEGSYPGGGTHVYLQHVYVRPSRGPFHASLAVPKDVFFTNQPVQMPSYPFLRYTVEKNLKFSGFIARS